MRNNLYRFLTILCLFTLGISTLFAVPAYRGWRTMTQPDGTTITVRQMGDEFFHYWENENEQQVAKDADGWWRVLDNPATQTKKQIKKQASRKYNTAPEKPAKVGGINLALRGLVILVNFSDVSFRSENTQSAMSDLMNSTNYTHNNATGSVREFFKAQSGGAYVPDFDVVGPYTLNHTRAYYGANDASGDDVLPGDMIVEACKAADADGVDFTKYNNNGDTYVDFVYVIYAGEGEADSDEEDAIWPINWDLTSAKYHGYCTYEANQRKFDGLTVNSFACSGELRGRTTTRAGIGTICHEFSHVLGLPDYYVTQNNASNKGKKYDPGAWHLMDYGNYNNNGRTPPNYSPHDKYFFGWLTPTLLAKDAKQNCTLTTTHGSAYQITGGTTLKGATSSDRVWYLENRQKSGWDAYLPGHGMVVWEVTYNSSDWTANGPNNENIGYTIVTANDLTRPYKPYVINTTAASTSGTPFPGTGNVTSWTPAIGCALTEITESGGNITFKYNGGQEKWSYALLGDHCTYPSDGEVNFNASLSLTITPDAGYTLADAACWEVTMGATTLTYGTDFTYNASTNTFNIPSVTGNVEMYIYGGRPVTWIANGSTHATNLATDNKITLPSDPADCSGGKKFVGWCTNSSYSHATTAPTFAKTGDAYSVATYYAVYATAGGSGSGSDSWDLCSDAASVTEGTYIITWDNSLYLPSETAATSNPAVGSGITQSDGSLTNTVTASMQWTLSGNNTDGFTISHTTSGTPGTTYYLNSSDKAQGISVSTTDGTTWKVTDNTTYGMMLQGSDDGSRYLAVYNSASWRYYAAGASYTGTMRLYKKTSGSGTSYSDYSTTCTETPCDYKVTLTKGSETNGTFTLDKANGEHNNCTANFVVTVSNITPASGYYCTGVTATGGTNASVSGPDGSGNYTVTYTKNNSITSTITANFAAVPTHTVIWSANGSTTTENYAEGAAITFPTSATGCTGKVFKGWSSTTIYPATDTEPTYVTSATMGTSDITYYAVFATETSGGGGTPTTLLSEDFSSITSGNSTSTSGSSSSWSGNANITGVSTAYQAGGAVRIGSGSGKGYIRTKTLTASEGATLNVAFDVKGWSSVEGSIKVSVTDCADQTITYTATMSNDFQSKSAEFTLVSDNPSVTIASTAKRAFIDNVVITSGGSGSTTYSDYTTTCTTPTTVTVTFNANGGEGTMADQTIPYNEATALNANTFTRTGYTFQGWATSASGTKTYNDKQNVTLTKNTDLYAVWQKNSHNVSYSITPVDKATATINSSATTPQSIEYGETVTLDITPDAEYNISSVTATGGVTLSGTGTQRTFTMPDNDVAISITLAAKPKYTVTWSANGSTTTEEYLEGATITFPTTAASCGDKAFVGWSTAEIPEPTDTKPTTFVTSATMGTSPLTYYAVFAESSTGSGANKFKRITADDELVRASGTQIAIISNHAGKILQNDFTSVDAPTPDGDGLITVTDDQIWTLTEKDSYDYWKLMSGTVQLGVNTTSGYSSGYQVCGNYSTDASWWYITHADNVSGTDDCFYLYNWHSSNWYDLLEFYGGSTQKWESVYFANTSASGFATYGAMRIYVPAASYTGYTTTCVPCDYKVTLTKGAEENGTFTLSKSNGTYNNCTSNFVVTVSGITPAEHYTCSGVTATGGNSTVTGPDGSGNYTVTYTKGNSITSTITANFTPESKYTVIWSQNGDNSNTAEYYEGDAIVFPTTATGCDGKVFVGWSADPVAETDDEPTYVTSATMGTSDLTYYAVFANASGSSSGSGPDPGTTLWAETFSSYDANDVPSGAVDNSNTGTTVYGTGSVTYACESGGTTTQIYSTGGPGSGNNLLISKGHGTFTVVGIPTGGATELTVTYAKSGSGSIKLTVSDNASKSGNASGSTITVNSGSTIDITFENTTSGSNLRLDDVAVKVAGEEITYSGYTTTCGASISAKNIGWITATKGQKVKRVINVSAAGFDEAATLSATSSNSHFTVSLAETAVPGDKSSLATTLTVEYNPAEYNVKETDATITLTAGSITKEITVSGRSLPEEFLLITKKSDTWYALPANMTGGPGEYDGVQVVPNNLTTPTKVDVSPSTIIYTLASNHADNYAIKGDRVRLVGNDNLCLWSNKASETGQTNIQNKTSVATATTGNHEWLLTTTDGVQYTIYNPNHPDYPTRRLGYGAKFGLYAESSSTSTIFYIVESGCTTQPGNVTVSARRADATFSWESNASSVQINLYSDKNLTTQVQSVTATSQPYVLTGLQDTTKYWFKLIPTGDEACYVIDSFKTTGPIIDITEWKEDGVVLYIDKGDINPVIVIDGQEEHGSITGGGGTATELFFAKYFEGAGSMKLLSIFNGTQNSISLDKYSIAVKVCGNSNNKFNGDVYTYAISALGTIRAGQEIIFFSKPKSGESPYDCSTKFLDSIAKLDGANANPRWILCDGSKTYNDETFRVFDFSGNDPVMLLKENTSTSATDTIDVIGARWKEPTTKDCRATDYGWQGQCLNMDFKKSPSSEEFTNLFAASSKNPSSRADSIAVLAGFGINLSDSILGLNGDVMATARCILFRNKSVQNGANAVLQNTSSFATFTADEWNGRSVCINSTMQTAAGVSGDGLGTCNSYQALANMDYNEYYIDYTSHIEPGQTLDHYTHDDETHLYTIPIDNLSNYTCLNIRFQLKKDGEVLTEEAQQVPIIVSGSKTTKDDLFSKLVIDQETHLPSYSHSVERCKTCNVVVLADATLTKAADDDGSDVPQVSNVKVYPTGKLYVPSGTNYTVNSLSLRRQEDDVASAKIEGTLNVLTDDATYLDIRIDPTNWHYFTLPYDCNVSDIRFANEEETAIPQVGSDFLLCSYDGEHRAATKSTSWKDLTSTDVLKKGIGYIIAIPGDGKVQREFRFPMANTVLTEENDDKLIGDLHAWGGNDAELRPNHKGWNLIGNPYMMYYNLPTTTTPLAAGTLIHDPDEDPWLGHWVIKDGTGDDAATPLYYIVVPQDNGWSEYKQTTIGGFDMPPFTSYFVQLGGNPDENKGINFVTTNKEDGPSPVIRRAPAEDIVDNHEVWFGVDLINTDGESDETTLLMSDKFTNDYDMMRDLVKMRGTYYTYYTKPVLASRNNEGEMAFNALPDSTAAAGVPLSFFAAADGQYRFTVSAHYPLDEVKEAYIYDNDNADAKWHNLLQEDYVFNTKRGDNTSRFLLAVKVERKQPEITTSIDNLHKGLVLTTINRTLMLSGLTNDADIYVYDVSGKLLDARLHYSSESGIFRTTVNTAGLYFVRVKTPDGQQTLETVVY